MDPMTLAKQAFMNLVQSKARMALWSSMVSSQRLLSALAFLRFACLTKLPSTAMVWK